MAKCKACSKKYAVVNDDFGYCRDCWLKPVVVLSLSRAILSEYLDAEELERLDVADLASRLSMNLHANELEPALGESLRGDPCF